MKKGIYVSPTEFVSFTEPRLDSKLSDHIATRERSPNFTALGLYLPNPDPVLKKLGRDLSVYRDLRSDAHVGGCIRRRKAAVKGMEYRIVQEKASERSAALGKSSLQALDIDRLLNEITDAVLYGWQPLEINWIWRDGARVFGQVWGKPGEWFSFDDQSQLRFRSREQPLYGEVLQARKFLVPAQEASYANPYGHADLSMCFWPTVFKRGGLKFWVTFAEKFGTPWVVGKTPRGTLAPEQNKLLDQLEMMVQDAVAVIPDDASVDIMDAAGKNASGEMYERLLMFCRSEVSIALLGQNQSTEASSTHASASAGLEVADSLRDSDARLVEATINQLLRWQTDLNEGEQAPSPKFELFEAEELDLTLAQRDETLTRAGVRFKAPYWKRTYNLQNDDFELVPAGANNQPSKVPPGPAFAEQPSANKPVPVDAVTQTLAQAGDVVLAGWMQQIEKMVNAANSPNELRDQLLQAYGGLPTDKLTEVMALAFAAAELAGMYAVATETAQDS